MGISAVASQPGTSKRHRTHPVYPYLLRHRTITRPNDVWGMDITYIPMARGFVYLTVVMDRASRRVLSSRVSVTRDSAFCIAAVEEAFAKYGCPEILNTTRGRSLLPALPSPGCSISTGSASAWMAKADGATTSLSNACGVRSHTKTSTCTPIPAATAGLKPYLTLYDTRLPHSSIAGQTPDEAYFTPLSIRRAA